MMMMMMIDDVLYVFVFVILYVLNIKIRCCGSSLFIFIVIRLSFFIK